MADEMVCSIVVPFTETTLEVAVLGFCWRTVGTVRFRW
jgi:hypothetical protein